MIAILFAWTALAAFEDRMFAEAARLAVEDTLPLDRWVRAVSFRHLGWNESLRTLLSPPRTRAETLLLVDALLELEPESIIPLVRPYLQDSALRLWARDRLVQAFLRAGRPWDAFAYVQDLPPSRRRIHLPDLVREAEENEDTALIFALLSDMETLLPPASLFWKGVLIPERRREFWNRLLLRYPDSPWAQRAYGAFRPSREAELSILLARGKYSDVLKKTRLPRTHREVEARFLAFYRRDRYRRALEVYRTHRRAFRRLSPERTFQALIAAYYAGEPHFPTILLDLLKRRSRRYTDHAAHLTAHYLRRHPERYNAVAPLALRFRSGDLAFQLGIVSLTWNDTTQARVWFARALEWAQDSFLATQAAFWLRRIGEEAGEQPISWYSYYGWVDAPVDSLDVTSPLDPPAVVEEGWLWAARLGETWWLSDSIPLPALKDLVREAYRWGHTALALRWAYRYAARTGRWEEMLPYLFPRPYRRVVCEVAPALGVDPALVWAIMREESHFTPGAVSRAGAVGLMQIMPYTARRVAGRNVDLTDPGENIRVGVRYLARLLGEFPHVMAALAAYNAGERHARRWLEIPVSDPLLFVEWIGFRETRNYVRRVFRSYLVYGSMEKSTPACTTGL